jgi:hypothetical protein
LLVSGGLTDALPAAAGRAALPTTLELDNVGRYGNDLEAAVYFCTLEALQTSMPLISTMLMSISTGWGAEFVARGHRFLARRDLGDQFEARHPIDHGTRRGAKRRLVVHDHHADAFTGFVGHGSSSCDSSHRSVCPDTVPPGRCVVVPSPPSRERSIT